MEKELVKAINSLNRLIKMVEEYKDKDEAAYVRLMKQYTDQLGKVHALRDSVDVQIPPALIGFVDEGKNPRHFTQQVAEDTLNRLNDVHGKRLALQKLKAAVEVADVEHE